MRSRTFISILSLALVAVFGTYGIAQEHIHEHEEMHTGEVPQMTMIGDGVMTHTCPMAGDKVFADSSGTCPKCGMKLKEMSEIDMEHMHEMMKTHMHVDGRGHERGTEGYVEHMAKGETMMMMGGGDMTHMCPMKGDKVFADGEGDCPVCGMKLRKMTGEQVKEMNKMRETHPAVTANGAKIKKKKR